MLVPADAELTVTKTHHFQMWRGGLVPHARGALVPVRVCGVSRCHSLAELSFLFLERPLRQRQPPPPRQDDFMSDKLTASCIAIVPLVKCLPQRSKLCCVRCQPCLGIRWIPLPFRCKPPSCNPPSSAAPGYQDLLLLIMAFASLACSR